MKMPKSALILLVSAVMVSVMMASVTADPLTTNATIDDTYTVTTIRGEARTVVNGQVIVRQADLQLKIGIAEINNDWIGFKVVSGSIQIGTRVFCVVSERGRGLYSRNRRTSVCEGWAKDTEGNLIYFTFRSIDISQTQQGCFMDINELVRGPEGHYWKLDLKAYRFKVN
jgi:hypothetical protein